MQPDFPSFKQQSLAAISRQLAAANGLIRYNFTDAAGQPVFLFAALDGVQTDILLQRESRTAPAAAPESPVNEAQLQHIVHIVRMNTGLQLDPPQLREYLKHHRDWCLAHQQEPVFIEGVGPWYPDGCIPETAHRRLCASFAAWLGAPPWPANLGPLDQDAMAAYFEQLWRYARVRGIRNIFLS